MRYFLGAQVGPLPIAIALLALCSSSAAETRAVEPAAGNSLALPSHPLPARTRRRTVPPATITSRAEVKLAAATGVGTDDPSKRRHRPGDGDRQEVDFAKPECDTPRVESRPVNDLKARSANSEPSLFGIAAKASSMTRDAAAQFSSTPTDGARRRLAG